MSSWKDMNQILLKCVWSFFFFFLAEYLSSFTFHVVLELGRWLADGVLFCLVILNFMYLTFIKRMLILCGSIFLWVIWASWVDTCSEIWDSPRMLTHVSSWVLSTVYNMCHLSQIISMHVLQGFFLSANSSLKYYYFLAICFSIFFSFYLFMYSFSLIRLNVVFQPL